jgi:hypothetical protein
MSGTSDFEQNKYLDATLRGQTYTALTNVYVALLKCTKGAVARSTAYALNDTVAVVALDGFNHLYKVTTAGTTAGSAPTYAGASNEVIADGTAVLTEQASSLEANTSMNEVSGGAYARVTVACSLAAWAGSQSAGSTAASSGTSATTSNNAAITFTQASANWTTSPEQIWGFALYDASTAGNLIRYGGFTVAQTVLNTNTFSIASGQMTVKVDK